jgi:hypothetical protein
MSIQPAVVRVFVSSTWLDLQPERQAVEATLQRMRETKLVGMEYFGSRDENTRHASLNEVDRSQVYVGIFGGRYGSGITEAEYRRARERGLPCFIYFKDDASIPSEKRETDSEKSACLATFKEELRLHHTVAPPFSTPDDLAAKVTADLHNWLLEKYLPQLLSGITSLPTDYASRIKNFLTEYLGTPEHPVPFGGRDADFSRLDAWLNDPASPPYLLLAAPAGRGKSALLARWSIQLLAREEVAVVFFPVSIRFRTNLSSVVFAALTARLAVLHGDQVPGGPDTPVEIWRGLMVDYLSRPLPEGRRLLLILDGVDEAADWELGPDLFPLAPPKGLRVVLSTRYRAGDVNARSWLSSLGWNRPSLASTPDLAPLTSEGVAEVLRLMGFPLDYLGARVDIVVELHRLSEGDPLLVRLYVDDLWFRGGAAVRLSPEDLRAIHPGLDGYFTRWWEDQRRLWGKDLSPLREPAVQALLALLSCALGPLSREDVLRLAPPAVGLNTFTLEEVALISLKRFVIGDGRQQGYVFGHPRLGAYFYERLAEQERRAWEERFITFGEETLTSLNERQLSPDKPSPYIVQHYGAHLERAGCSPEALLALVGDGWRQAWEKLEGAYAGFLNDVSRAWRVAERADLEATVTGHLAPYLGGEVRCALCQASINSLAGNIPPALLLALVEKAIWTPAQGLVYARQAPDPVQRSRALAYLARCLPGPLLRDALEAAQTIADEYDRARVLARLAPRLAELGSPQEVLKVARAIKDADVQVQALANLASHLSEPLRMEVLHEALAAAQALQRESKQALGMPATGVTSSIEFWRIPMLNAIQEEFGPARVLAYFVSPSSEPLKAEVWYETLARAKEIGDAPDQARVLIALAPHLPEPVKGNVLREALEAGRTIGDVSDRARVLTALAPHLPDLLLRETLEVVQTIKAEYAQVKILAKLASNLPEPLKSEVLHEALEAARAIKDRYYGREQALADLVPYLPEPLKGEVLHEALEAARAIGVTFFRGLVLTGLVSYLSEPLKHEVLHKTLEAIRGIEGARDRVQFLAKLAPSLSEPLKSEVLHEALEVARASEYVSKHVPALIELVPYLPDLLQQEAMGIARAIEEALPRMLILTELAPYLPEPLKSEVLHETLEVIQGLEDAGYQARFLTKVAPHLSEPLKSKVLDEALEATCAIENPEYWPERRAEALTSLTPHLVSLPTPKLYRLWFKTLHQVAAHGRRELLSDLCTLTPVLAKLGGVEATTGTARAILDVGRWWP